MHFVKRFGRYSHLVTPVSHCFAPGGPARGAAFRGPPGGETYYQALKLVLILKLVLTTQLVLITLFPKYATKARPAFSFLTNSLVGALVAQ